MANTGSCAYKNKINLQYILQTYSWYPYCFSKEEVKWREPVGLDCLAQIDYFEYILHFLFLPLAFAALSSESSSGDVFHQNEQNDDHISHKQMVFHLEIIRNMINRDWKYLLSLCEETSQTLPKSGKNSFYILKSLFSISKRLLNGFLYMSMHRYTKLSEK